LSSRGNPRHVPLTAVKEILLLLSPRPSACLCDCYNLRTTSRNFVKFEFVGRGNVTKICWHIQV
jgi:hypothetical protein